MQFCCACRFCCCCCVCDCSYNWLQWSSICYFSYQVSKHLAHHTVVLLWSCCCSVMVSSRLFHVVNAFSVYLTFLLLKNRQSLSSIPTDTSMINWWYQERHLAKSALYVVWCNLLNGQCTTSSLCDVEVPEMWLLLDSGASGFCRSYECCTSTDKVEHGGCLAPLSTYTDRQVLFVRNWCTHTHTYTPSRAHRLTAITHTRTHTHWISQLFPWFSIVRNPSIVSGQAKTSQLFISSLVQSHQVLFRRHLCLVLSFFIVIQYHLYIQHVETTFLVRNWQKYEMFWFGSWQEVITFLYS